MKHIVHFSGGKDSTAMLLMMLERGMQVDEIIFCDTGKEFPQMYDHIDAVERYIDRPITRLKSDKSFDYYMFEHETKSKKAAKKTKGYGWARSYVRWCTRVLKKEPTQKHLKQYREVTEYIGIARDEEKRHKAIPKNTVHPLYDWDITEAQALQYCYEKGFDWGGLYEKFGRVSCWCCPLQPLEATRSLRKYCPVLWAELLKMDEKTEFGFRKDFTAKELDIRFQLEDELKAEGKPIKGKAFFAELKRRLGRE